MFGSTQSKHTKYLRVPVLFHTSNVRVFASAWVRPQVLDELSADILCLQEVQDTICGLGSGWLAVRGGREGSLRADFRRT